jgi:hypothetical protein
MTAKRQPGVLGSLPRTRPHRRSDKRPDAAAPEPNVSAAVPAPKRTAAKPRAAAKPRPAPKPRAAKPSAAAKPAGTPTDAPKARPTQAREAAPPPAAGAPGTLETAVQAAAELAEIGLQASARALRRTLSRLPRP